MILLASSSQTLCRRWRDALAGSFPLHQVADRQTLILSLQEHQPDVVFLDQTDKHFGPVRFVCKLIRLTPTSRIIVLTREPRASEAMTLIKAGAKGYCAANIGPALLRKAARTVSAGEIWIGRKLLPPLIDDLVHTTSQNAALIESLPVQPSTFNAFSGLSPREREIASLVATGQHNKSISSNLHISEKTVKAHLTTIFRKLQIEGRTQLALAVIGTHQQLTLSRNGS